MQKVLIKDIIEAIELLAPLNWQEEYDNSGLTLGNIEEECKGVYVCLDVSDQVINKALEENCNLIISHHPIIFKGIKKIDYSSKQGNVIVKAIKNEITLYALHTNIDNALFGVNGILAEKLGLKNLKALSNFDLFENENWLGAGAIGELEAPINKEDFFNYLKKVLNIPSIKHNAKEQKLIQKVAVCGGSGSCLISNAIKLQADIVITADIKYHDFIDNDDKILLAEIGHFESEQFIKERIIAILSEKFCNFVPLILDKTPNGIKYF